MNKNKKKKIKEKCSVCGKEAITYCPSCSYTWGEFDPTYYCQEHYESVVMTGNCCRSEE
jgi:hypothetical protein